MVWKMLSIKILKLLLFSIVVMTLLNFIVLYLNLELGHDYIFGFSSFFHMDRENSLPAWFSTIILFVSAVLLWIIASSRYIKLKMHWLFLSFVFLFLSLDEAAIIHERIGELTKATMDAEFAAHWHGVYTYAILIILLIYPYTKFLLSQPKYYKNLFFLSGLLYCSGALGFEYFGDLVAGDRADPLTFRQNFAYSVFYTFEEVLEMTGVSIFIYALLKYIEEHNIPIGNKHQ